MTAGRHRSGARRLLRHAAHPRLRRAGAVLAVGLAGAALGLLLGASTERAVGPFDVRLSVGLAPLGDTDVEVAPLGALSLDTHDGPLRLSLAVTRLRAAEARQLLADPSRVEELGSAVASDLRAAALVLTARAVGAALAGALLLGAVVFRRWRPVGLAVAVAVAAVAGSAGSAYATRRADALAEPRYDGLLANAPVVVGDVRGILSRFDVYRRQLARLVGNVGELYAAATTLPVYEADPTAIRLLHVSDLHLSPSAYDVVRQVAEQFQVDLVLDTGDLTDFGSEPEGRYVAGIAGIGVPYLYVRGNHDSLATQQAVAAVPGAVVLDGQPVDVAGLRIVGEGDPRFTPDRSTRGSEREEAAALARSGRRLADLAAGYDPPPDLVAVHDPVVAEGLTGGVPLVLAGHTHARAVRSEGGTLVMVQGSTGGAGLRGLEGEDPTPIALSVVYLDRTTRRVVAYDDITLGGLGTRSATIERQVVAPPPVGEPGPLPQ